MIHAFAASEPGGRLQPFSYDPGPLGPTDVEISVEHCGICHSDLSMLLNDWGITRYPFVPGHEIAGRVTAVGEAVNHLLPGQAVGLGWHAGYCHTCGPCLSGDHNLCPQASSTIVGRHGGFAGLVRAQATAVVALPDGVPLETAGPLFCGGITVFNPLVQYNLPPTSRVAVVGIGGLGHLALQFLKAWGCHVTSFTSDSKRVEALALGAHEALDSRNPASFRDAAGSFDLILCTVNVPMDWEACLAALKPKGRLHLVGAVLEPLRIPLMPMISNQLSLSASPVGSPSVIARMLEFAARHGIQPVTEHFRFDQADKALEHLASGKARYRVVLSR